VLLGQRSGRCLGLCVQAVGSGLGGRRLWLVTRAHLRWLDRRPSVYTKMHYTNRWPYFYLFLTFTFTFTCYFCHSDVVEISSSEEDEDSDLIMMPSDTELDDDTAAASVADDDDEEEEEEDVANSGSHVNDALNQRDAMGGVLVNVGHPATETDIFLAPQLAAVVKPHQVNNYNIFIKHLLYIYFSIGKMVCCGQTTSS